MYTQQAASDDSSVITWVPATHEGEMDAVPGSWLQPDHVPLLQACRVLTGKWKINFSLSSKYIENELIHLKKEINSGRHVA